MCSIYSNNKILKHLYTYRNIIYKNKLSYICTFLYYIRIHTYIVFKVIRCIKYKWKQECNGLSQNQFLFIFYSFVLAVFMYISIPIKPDCCHFGSIYWRFNSFLSLFGTQFAFFHPLFHISGHATQNVFEYFFVFLPM